MVAQYCQSLNGTSKYYTNGGSATAASVGAVINSNLKAGNTNGNASNLTYPMNTLSSVESDRRDELESIIMELEEENR